MLCIDKNYKLHNILIIKFTSSIYIEINLFFLNFSFLIKQIYRILIRGESYILSSLRHFGKVWSKRVILWPIKSLFFKKVTSKAIKSVYFWYTFYIAFGPLQLILTLLICKYLHSINKKKRLFFAVFLLEIYNIYRISLGPVFSGAHSVIDVIVE